MMPPKIILLREANNNRPILLRSTERVEKFKESVFYIYEPYNKSGIVRVNGNKYYGFKVGQKLINDENRCTIIKI